MANVRSHLDFIESGNQVALYYIQESVDFFAANRSKISYRNTTQKLSAPVFSLTREPSTAETESKTTFLTPAKLGAELKFEKAKVFLYFAKSGKKVPI